MVKISTGYLWGHISHSFVLLHGNAVCIHKFGFTHSLTQSHAHTALWLLSCREFEEWSKEKHMYVLVCIQQILYIPISLWVCCVCVCVSSLSCVHGSRGVGVNSTHSPLSVGGEDHSSIKTAHQHPYKQLPIHYAYQTQHVSVLSSQHNKSDVHAHAQNRTDHYSKVNQTISVSWEKAQSHLLQGCTIMWYYCLLSSTGNLQIQMSDCNKL